MAVLKYKNEQGEFVTLTNYTVQPIVPVQTTGTSLSDVMSQKAVSDELEKKVNDTELNGKIADAIDSNSDVKNAINAQVSGAIEDNESVKEAVDAAVADAIKNTEAVTEAVEDVVDSKLSGYTDTEGLNALLAGKADKEHTHAASAVTDLSSTVENIISSSTTIETRIESVVTSAVSGSGEVNEAVEKAVEDALKDNEQVSGAVNTIIEEYTTTVLDDKYAEKSHTHAISDINDFDNAVAESVKTEITNNNSAITESIESVVEKYIYGDSEPSSTASVVTTDNLTTTLAGYAKSEDIPTDLSGFTNSPKYVKESEVNDLIATAITENQTVIDAVNSAITSAITSDTTVQTAIDKATENKFGGAAYDSDTKRINFYSTSAKTSVIDYIDASSFIVDGMVENVEIKDVAGIGTCLVVSFNTDSGGKQDINIPISQIFDANNYYTTGQTSGATQIQTALDAKSDVSHTHTASQITDFNAAVSGAVKNNADVKNEVISAVTASTEFTNISNGLTAHTANTNIHVTTEDKAKWDAKSDFSGSYADLTNVPTSFTPSEHTHASSGITTMAGYAKAESAADIATGDTLNVAMGKLEKKVDDAIGGVVSSVTLGSGTTDGTLTLTVNGTLQDTVNVPGLGGAAFLNTGTTAGTVAAGNHTHTASDVTDFNAAVSGAVKNNTDVKNEIISAVTASTEFTTLSGDVNTISGKADSAKAVTDFMSGHNTVTTLASIPTDKRLVIATIDGSSNELSLSDNTLTDGYEIHIIVKNNGSNDVTISLPSSGGYVSVGDTITINASSTGEINIISDGTNLYVRGV